MVPPPFVPRPRPRPPKAPPHARPGLEPDDVPGQVVDRAIPGDRLPSTFGRRTPLPGRRKAPGGAGGQRRPTGGRGPVLKGQAGIKRAIEEAKAKGWTVVAQEVEIVFGLAGGKLGRMRIDVVLEKEGRLLFLEVKHGPTARLARRQSSGLLALARGQARLTSRGRSTLRRARGPDPSVPKLPLITPEGAIPSDVTVSVLHFP